MNSEQLFEKSLKYVPGGVHSPVRSFKGLHTTPRFMNRSYGPYIYDEEGNKYIDFCMSFGPLILGHRNEEVETKIKESLERGWTYGACEKYSLDLAEYIVENIPFIDQIRFVNSGTEAVMTALRLARGYTGKDKIIKFNGCYHGHSDSMLIKSGSGLAGTAEASSNGVTSETAKDTLICELGDISKVKDIFNDHKNNIAGLIIEPLPANFGLLPQAKEFIQQLRELCTENNSLLIFDEVISGFRTSFTGMAGDLDIIPDMVTYGKIIGGGMPVGAVAAKRNIMEKLAPIGDVYQAGTLSANPVAMVAGLATLKQLTPEFYKKVNTYGKNIAGILNEWLQANDYADYQVVDYKTLFWLVPTADQIISPTQIPANLTTRFYTLFEKLLNKGIYLSPNAFEVGFVSSAHDENIQEQLKELLWK